MRGRVVQTLLLIIAVVLVACSSPDSGMSPLQEEASQFFYENRAAITKLADKIESDSEILSIQCRVALGVPSRVEAMMSHDGSTRVLEITEADEYVGLLRDARLCDAARSEDGVILHLFKIDQPTAVNYIDLLRAKSVKHPVCGGGDEDPDRPGCIVPLDADWSLFYSSNLKWVDEREADPGNVRCSKRGARSRLLRR